MKFEREERRIEKQKKEKNSHKTTFFEFISSKAKHVLISLKKTSCTQKKPGNESPPCGHDEKRRGFAVEATTYSHRRESDATHPYTTSVTPTTTDSSSSNTTTTTTTIINNNIVIIIRVLHTTRTSDCTLVVQPERSCVYRYNKGRING